MSDLSLNILIGGPVLEATHLTREDRLEDFTVITDEGVGGWSVMYPDQVSTPEDGLNLYPGMEFRIALRVEKMVDHVL